jgi:hypothetical protein
MFKRGQKGDNQQQPEKKMSKKEKRLAAEMAEKAELMRASGVDMPDPEQQRAVVAAAAEAARDSEPTTSGRLMPDMGRSINKARQSHGQQKQVKLSFKDRMTDKVASGQNCPPSPTLTPHRCDTRPPHRCAARATLLQECEAPLRRY